jgi:hypothetical protein
MGLARTRSSHASPSPTHWLPDSKPPRNISSPFRPSGLRHLDTGCFLRLTHGLKNSPPQTPRKLRSSRSKVSSRQMCSAPAFRSRAKAKPRFRLAVAPAPRALAASLSFLSNPAEGPQPIRQPLVSEPTWSHAYWKGRVVTSGASTERRAVVADAILVRRTNTPQGPAGGVVFAPMQLLLPRCSSHTGCVKVWVPLLTAKHTYFHYPDGLDF